jgi:nifR3 family TIM-barrel protein
MNEPNFYQALQQPIIGLSPMDGVTDLPFREIAKKYGNPAVMYTEFSSVEGLCRGAKVLLKEFRFTNAQRPMVGQIYGTTPDYFRQGAILLCELGFDGVDINMGCPAKNVAHSGAGAGLIRTPELAQQIIRATKQGVTEWRNGATVKDCEGFTAEMLTMIKAQQDELQLLDAEGKVARRHIPVTVKTRIGFDSIVIKDWIKSLLEEEPEVITVHGRTLRQLYTGEANWDAIADAATVVHESKLPILIMGNGDIKSYADALQKIANYKLDGALIGRAAFGNPWVFLPESPEISPHEKALVAMEHAELFEKTYGSDGNYNFLPMRKHLSWYTHGFPLAREVRMQLVLSKSSAEVKEIFQKFDLL